MSRPIWRIPIRGVSFAIKWVKMRGKLGECSSPRGAHPTIRLHPDLRDDDRQLMAIAAHEVLHAADWDKDEEAIDEMEDALVKVLYDVLGYRRTET